MWLIMPLLTILAFNIKIIRRTNILITNMKDQYMYKYDDVKGHFILVNKKDVLDSLSSSQLLTNSLNEQLDALTVYCDNLSNIRKSF